MKLIYICQYSSDILNFVFMNVVILVFLHFMGGELSYRFQTIAQWYKYRIIVSLRQLALSINFFYVSHTKWPLVLVLHLRKIGWFVGSMKQNFIFFLRQNFINNKVIIHQCYILLLSFSTQYFQIKTSNLVDHLPYVNSSDLEEWEYIFIASWISKRNFLF